ncbi:1-acyl-sn-glycerol-3-phosphate acyltransferase [Vibrio crassostreae]|uniref:1-acyl-sn-glycerol-3-phosphate acyltransferase n=1 Tax=Vibrio crassostreae TaxID=246167 RepID=UPI001B3036AB|nr:1-acyl-sn-glycerol-3-phosphate acyltransferase [Vibrio crassostreae]
MSYYRFSASLVRMFLSPFYKIKKENTDVPSEGAFIGIANHVSYLDGIIMASTIKRPMRFVMYWKIYETPVLKLLFKSLNVIPIASPRENREVYDKAVAEMDAEIKRGGAVFIFPEGMITYDGEMNEFKSGAVRLSQIHNCDVIPFGINGLWGSMYSRAKKRTTRLLRRNVIIKGGDVISHHKVKQKTLEDEVALLIK